MKTLQEIRNYAKLRGMDDRSIERLIDEVESDNSGNVTDSDFFAVCCGIDCETEETRKKVCTLSYVRGDENEIQIGESYYFGQLWDGSGDGDELLGSGAISPDGEFVVFFEQIDRKTDIMQTLVRVSGMC